MNKKILFIAIALANGLPTYSFADMADELKSVLEQNFEHTQTEDLEKVLATVHTQSPIYANQKQLMEQIFPVFDLKYQLNSFALIGQDADYAYARINFKTIKVDGPQFKDNEIDAIVVFKKENEDWKFWHQMNLEIRFLD